MPSAAIRFCMSPTDGMDRLIRRTSLDALAI